MHGARQIGDEKLLLVEHLGLGSSSSMEVLSGRVDDCAAAE
jgi:hypothetical protein